jgi:hypothetical protein
MIVVDTFSHACRTCVAPSGHTAVRHAKMALPFAEGDLRE